VALLPLWMGLETRRSRYFAVSGFWRGTAPCTYHAAIFLPGMLALFLFCKLFQERNFLRCYWRQLAVLALVAFLVLLPLATFA
jgi:hypothetical protein